ncbi:MAG: hypothetical protein IPJ60_07620 [Sphingobacteriaceae bacterium]|nr:hypothetical protein [Sphingobacteriaceae bacterium]
MENNKHLADRFIKGLRSFAATLEEVQLETALGKAEAKDKWNEFSKDLKKFLHESKMDYKNGTGIIGGLRTKVENLELQYSLGKADLKDAVSETKKNLNTTLQELDFMLQEKL